MPEKTTRVLGEFPGRKRAEEALRESEARYVRIAANAPGMVYRFVLRPDGSVAFPFVSEGCREVYGLEPREIMEDPSLIIDIVHPEDRPGFDRSVAESAAALSPWRWEGRVTLRSGERKWVQGASRPERQENGEIVFDGLLMDVTGRKRAEEGLRLRDRAIAASSNGIIITDPSRPDNPIVYVNRAFERVTGYAFEEAAGRNCRFLQGSHRDQPALDEVRAAVREGRECTAVLRNYRKDGAPFWNELYVSPVRDEGGRVTHFIGVQNDITERVRAEEALRESEERFRSLVQNSSDVITVLEADGTVRYESPSVERVLGYRPEELVGKSAFDLVHPDDAARVLRRFVEALDEPGANPTAEFRFRHKDGSWRYLEAIGANLLGDPSVRGIVVNSRDVTERRALERELAHQALHDALTGLPNRALLLDRLGHALDRAARREGSVAVLFLDLDNFKVVNDSLGHDVGDRLLKAVAERLSACLRPGDTAARLGGDEFVVLLEDIEDGGEATRVAGRIAEGLRAPFVLGGHKVFATASIGIALGGTGEDRPEGLLRDADLAMYAAKNGGKARHEVFDPRMNGQALERLRLETDLRRALERGEFEVYYQPEVLLGSGRVVGAEALLRWKHPERGLVLPAEFVPLMEETGLIVPAGRWVLGEVCRQARSWQDHYPCDPPLLLSVNLSARQFQHEELVRDVAEALSETGADPRGLCLEITESVVMEDAPSTVTALEELKRMGVRLAIDDFGTGYSSLAYLKRFPVDYLKVDRSFVDGLGEEAEDTAIVSGITGLAHALGLKVIAEGVETGGQLARLREMGCDLAQGYYLAKPLPSEEASALLANDPRSRFDPGSPEGLGGGMSSPS